MIRIDNPENSEAPCRLQPGGDQCNLEPQLQLLDLGTRVDRPGVSDLGIEIFPSPVPGVDQAGSGT